MDSFTLAFSRSLALCIDIIYLNDKSSFSCKKTISPHCSSHDLGLMFYACRPPLLVSNVNGYVKELLEAVKVTIFPIVSLELNPYFTLVTCIHFSIISAVIFCSTFFFLSPNYGTQQWGPAQFLSILEISVFLWPSNQNFILRVSQTQHAMVLSRRVRLQQSGNGRISCVEHNVIEVFPRSGYCLTGDRHAHLIFGSLVELLTFYIRVSR